MGTEYYELSEEQIEEILSRGANMAVQEMHRHLAEMEGRLMQAVGGAALQQHLDRELQRMEEGLARTCGYGPTSVVRGQLEKMETALLRLADMVGEVTGQYKDSIARVEKLVTEAESALDMLAVDKETR